jgi:DNA polymerase-1
MAKPDRLILVDGYAQIYRGFYAVRGLTNPAGEPSNALFAFARFLMTLQEEWQPAYAAVVFDKGKPKHRLEILPDYKATRPPMPDDLRRQLPAIREWIRASGWPLLEEEGREADDLLAAIVGAREGHETLIVSHDKDLGQLVSDDGVSQLVPGRKGGLDRLGPKQVEEKFGVPPEALRDYLALLGDSVDNIPGVPGVGPKTAAALLQQFGSIDVMLANAEKITTASLREKITRSAEILRRNQQLVSLCRDLPPDWHGLDALTWREPDWDKLLDIARTNGFKSLIPALEKARKAHRSPTLFDF